MHKPVAPTPSRGGADAFRMGRDGIAAVDPAARMTGADMATPTQAGPSARPPLPWMDRIILRGATRPDWMAVAGTLAVLGVAWVVTYLAGGTRTAMPHVFYIPIIAATIRFGFRGVIPMAVLAGSLCGPLMPLDTSTGASQAVSSWLLRATMFLLVGATFALALQIRERVAEHEFAAEVRDAVFAESDAYAEGPDADPAIVAVLDQVIADRAFHTVYQPIYALTDGRLHAFEALTRFDAEPRRTPDVWFRTAAAVGRGVDLEVAAIELALAGSTEIPPTVALAVNASPETLADPRLAAIIKANPARIIAIEVTEHAAVSDYRMLADVVAGLRELGALLSVDDAGAGFASLRHIIHLMPETIKIDLSLTQGVGSSPLKRALAGALVEFAGATGAFTVAEGVEEPEDLVAWASLGATAVQGYLTGRPGGLGAPVVSEIVLALTRGNRLPAQATGEHVARQEHAVREPGTRPEAVEL